ncbi:MAG: ThuA domain-containing protein [Actinomycetota bacterium]
MEGNGSDCRTAVLLVGGSPHAHDFDDIEQALVTVLAASGVAPRVVRHPDALIDALENADVLVMHGLWWRMLGEAYDSWRDPWGYATTAELRTTLPCWVEGGGRLLALHTSPICFDDWPEWGQLLGGGWVWGTSSHPPPASVAVQLERHALTDGIDATLTVVDEVYGDLDMAEDIHVVGRACRSDDDDLQPIIWTRNHGAGRIVCDLLGHDRRSLLDDDHRRLLANAIGWLTTDEEAA